LSAAPLRMINLFTHFSEFKHSFVFDDVRNILYSTDQNPNDNPDGPNVILTRTRFAEKDPFGCVKLSNDSTPYTPIPCLKSKEDILPFVNME
jgi:hypothetical protein